jgi:type I restriction enzyme M protein
VGADQPQGARSPGHGARDRRQQRTVLEAHAEEPGGEAPRAVRDGIKLVTRLYGEGLDGDGEHHEISRILPTSTFGYRRITVERPLRLRLVVDEAALERLQTKKSGQKLAEAGQAELLDTLREGLAGHEWPSREAFRKHLKAVFRATSTLTLAGTIEKVVVEACGARDPEAPICLERVREPRRAKGRAFAP